VTVFRGRVVSADADASTVVVRVRHRNRWARVWRGEEVMFSLADARIHAEDVDGDGVEGVADLQAGDRVLVKARVARDAAEDGATIAAKRLIDLTSLFADEDDEDELVEEPAPVDDEPAPVEDEPVADEPVADDEV
jgi:hypothetical protein